MTTRPSRIEPERLADYDRLIATLPGVERRGTSMPYTSLNGHMFSYLDPTGTLAIRLAPADREAFMTRYDASLQVAHGATQKEYVAVPAALLPRTDALVQWFAASHAYVAGLQPRSRRS